MVALTPTFGWLDFPDYRGYVPGDVVPPPNHTSFLEPGMTGERLNLTGKFLNRVGASMADVKIEFWHADAAGEYDRVGYKLRGWQRTKLGRYALETIMPGRSNNQPRHVNYIATAYIEGRTQPLLLSAAIFFAATEELDLPVTDANRAYVRPGARTFRDDSSYLALSALPVIDGVRHAAFDIIFDFE